MNANRCTALDGLGNSNNLLDDEPLVPSLDFNLSELFEDINEDSFEIEDGMFDPVYGNATISKCGAYCAIMEYKRSCRLPFTAIEKLLQLLQLICPADNSLPRSVYALKKFFTKLTSTFQRRQFCADCNTELREDQRVCENTTCRKREPNCLITLHAERAIRRVLQSKNLTT